jgi:hypothetical protein
MPAKQPPSALPAPGAALVRLGARNVANGSTSAAGTRTSRVARELLKALARQERTDMELRH